MTMILNTPAKRRILAIISIPVVLASPAVVFMLITTRFLEGAYPPDADSIGLPIFGHALIIWPITLIMLTVALIRYPGSVSLWAWNTRRMVRSLLWTLVCLWATLDTLNMLIESVQGRFPAMVAFWSLDIYVLMSLRAAIVGRRNAEPAGGAYGSPAAGDPSAHP